MKEFWIVMKRFLPPFKRQIVLNFVFNILSAIFAVFSMVMMYPILEILFGTAEDVSTQVPMQFTKDAILHNAYFHITNIKYNYGAGWVLALIGSILIIATLLKVGFTFLAARNIIIVRNGVVKNLRKDMYNKIMSLPLAFYSDEKKGDIIARTTGDVTEVEVSIMSSLNMLLKNPTTIVIILISLLLMSYQLTLFVFVLLPIAGLIIGRVGKSLKKKSKEGQTKMGEVLGIIEETLSGLRIIKAFNAEAKMDKKFDVEIDNYRNIQTKLMTRHALAHPMSEFLGTIVMVAILWFGGSLILNGKGSLNGALFITYLGLFYQIINPAKAFSNAFYTIQKGLAAIGRIDKILLANNPITSKANAMNIQEFGKTISFENVSFSYGEKDVLKNIDLTITKGKTVALVGQSGSGKSTLVDLLPRFYDVKSGSIKIDGVDIRDLSLKSLRGLMGNVNQEAILFNDTIYNNIAFGVDSATQEEVERAAKIANAHDFIMETEHGYETEIGDRGSRLSGGQRQRISIARAVLANPPILILDEATSALDTQSEVLVQEALENLMKNRTTVVIAHRLSTIRNADTICVLHEGEIVEQGTHENLLEREGTYNTLHKMQIR